MTIQKILWYVSFILVFAGAFNWGLVGLFGMDLIARIFGGGSFVARVLYVLIGVAALYLLFLYGESFFKI